MQHSYLIVGGGLAGMLLARQLHARGLHTVLVDDERPSAASRVAAGLLNPVAGMRFNPPIRVDAWLAAAHEAYSRIEAERGRQLLHAAPMYRLFRSEAQERFYERRAGDALWRHLFGARFGPCNSASPLSPDSIGFNAPYGGFEQPHTGWLEIAAVLEHERERLRLADALVTDAIAPTEVALQPAKRQPVRWRGERFDAVIYCEGYRGRDNPWFAHLPWAPAKGELLTIGVEAAAGVETESEAAQSGPIINGAHWLIPLGGQRYRFGATHEHKWLDEVPTAAARVQLLAGLRALLGERVGVTLIDQRAGVRPASADRLPFVGSHPQRPSIMIFNGFGARGGLSIPYYAQRMGAWLADAQPLPQEAVPIGRRCMASRGRRPAPGNC